MSLIVSSRRMLPFDAVIWPNFPVTTWTLPYDGNRSHDSTFSNLIFFPRTFSVFSVVNCRSLLTRPAYGLAALRFAGSPFAIRVWRPLESPIKSKNIWKTHLLLRILAVIGRYGPHLMIVMIFGAVSKGAFPVTPTSEMSLTWHSGVTDIGRAYFGGFFFHGSGFVYGIYYIAVWNWHQCACYAWRVST